MKQTAPMAWGAHVSAAFRARVFRLCDALGWREEHASWLMACMAFETGLTFSPSIRNPASSAVGLIQFMAATARALGTSSEALCAMSPVRQLDYVERYFRPVARRIASPEDLYMAILWPAAIGKRLETVLWLTGTRAYAMNRGLDRNRDGRVVKAEAASRVQALLAEGLLEKNCSLPLE